MNHEEYRRAERLLTRALRHRPDLLGVTVDKAGYCPISDLLRGLQAQGYPATEEELLRMGETQERLSISPSGDALRADYGNSLGLRLPDMYELGPEPPERLYHGTSLEVLESIRAQGILRHETEKHRARDHVFLTELPEVALKKGKRHGSPIALPVLAQKLHQAGLWCYHAKNDIWLTDHIPPEFIDFDHILT